MSMLSRGFGRRRHAVATVVALALASTTLWAGAAPAAVPCSAPPPTFPTDQMTAGMRGTGYTVIRGTEVVPFDVEILGVLPNAIYLGIDVIAARITGPASFVNTTGGAVAGMSGSPVYVNDRLAGAVAWAIAEDRQIFGMTAAEDMVQLFSVAGAEGSAVPDRVPLSPEVRRTAREAGSPLAPGASLEALPLPLGVSGLNGVPLAKVERSFSRRGLRVLPFRAGSVPVPSTPTIDPSRFSAGEGFGVGLSYGDVSYYGFGTTTAVCGDVAIAMGHPMLTGSGRLSVGMNDVDIIAIDNGTFWGRKIGTIGDLHGEMTRDSFAGVVGVFGQLPNLVPVTSVMSSPDTELSRRGETQIAWDEDWFVADAATYHAWSNLVHVRQGDGPGTLEFAWRIEGTREDGSTFTVSNRLMQYDRSSAGSGIWRMGEALYLLAFNEFEDVQFTGVDMTAEVTDADLTSRIVRLRLSSPLQRSLRERSVVRAGPGQVVTVEVTFQPADGGEVVATLRLQVPRRADGMERVRLAGGRGRSRGVEAGSFDELVKALSGGSHANDLTVSAFGRSRIVPQDVIVRGSVGFTVKVV